MGPFMVGDTVRIRDGRIGRLLGIVAGVAHIGLPDKTLVTARSTDISPSLEKVELPPPVIEVPKKQEETVSVLPTLANVEVIGEQRPSLTKQYLSDRTVEELKYLLTFGNFSSAQKTKIRKAISDRNAPPTEGTQDTV